MKPILIITHSNFSKYQGFNHLSVKSQNFDYYNFIENVKFEKLWLLVPIFS